MKTTGVLYNHNKLLKLGKKIEIIVDTTFEITRRSSAYVTLLNKSLNGMHKFTTSSALT